MARARKRQPSRLDALFDYAKKTGSYRDLVRAIVEDHSIAIDRYHENTGDKANYGAPWQPTGLGPRFRTS